MIDRAEPLTDVRGSESTVVLTTSHRAATARERLHISIVSQTLTAATPE